MIKYLVALVIHTITSWIYRLKCRFHTGMRVRTEPAAEPLDPSAIRQFTSQLVKPPVYVPIIARCLWWKKHRKHVYFVDITEFKQQVLPAGYPETTVWGYGGKVKAPETGKTVYSRSAPGATFEAERGVPVTVRWTNRLYGPNLFAVDPTLHWANPNDMSMEPPMPWPDFPQGFPEAQSPVPIVTHLHGGEVPSIFDGHPDAWFTFNGKKGPEYVTSCYSYPNRQLPTTLWYHDHALGITRLNVHAGLAGFYLLRDPENPLDQCCCRSKSNKSNKKGGNKCSPNGCVLPCDEFEIPLAIQDRSFNTDGSFAFNTVGVNPKVHPYWVPEFFGNTITVNGKVWPNLNVKRRQYRFRVLNGSNARFYNLHLPNGKTFVQIGSDGGYLPKPVTLESLLIAPGERADILIDFSDLLPGESILLTNDARAPFPDGDLPDENTTGRIMQFTVPLDADLPLPVPELPEKLNDIPALKCSKLQRVLTLNEVMGDYGPLEVLLNGQKWSATISEWPRVGTVEDWIIVNLTADTHPIHLHLVQFQVISRQHFDVDAYMNEWMMLNGMPPLQHPTKVLLPDGYLIGQPEEPSANEKGWKDTVKADKGMVTHIRIRFTPQEVPEGIIRQGENLYPFDPSDGPGYVWHCHILDHEDNEMMRPYKVRH